MEQYSRRQTLFWVLHRISTSSGLKEYLGSECSPRRLQAVYPHLTQEDAMAVGRILSSNPGCTADIFVQALDEMGVT